MFRQDYNFSKNMLRFKDLQEFFSNFKIFELFEKKSSKQKTSEEEKQGAFHCYAYFFQICY